MLDILAPSDFAGDWYGYLTNQTGHFVLGLIVWAGLAWWLGRVRALILGGLVYAGVEIWQFTIAVNIWDALEDWLFVMAGAVAGYLASLRKLREASVVLLGVSIALVSGALKRR